MSISTKKFWEIIDLTSRRRIANRKSQVVAIAKILSKYSLEDIATFNKHLNHALRQAYTFPLMVAAFTVHSHITDDLFLDFCAWIILHGRATFERAIANPDIVAKLVSKKEADDITAGNFTEMPTRIWLDRGGDIIEYSKKIGYLTTPVVKQSWPKDVQEFRERYPVLFKAFWNPQRIKAFSALT